MRLKMLKTAAGPEGAFLAGRVCEVPDHLAEAFVAAEAAVPVDGPAAPAGEGEPGDPAPGSEKATNKKKGGK